VSITSNTASIAANTASITANTTAINTKQNALTAGSGISISGATISATGLTTANLSSTAGITVDQLATKTTTLGSTTMTLGGTVTSVTGLTSIGANNFIGSGSQLTDVATKVTGSWNVPNGTNYFTIGLSPGTYIIWVNGNVPNGIITYNALVTITNTNVPASGNYSSWVYNGGGTPLDFIFLPDQIVGSNTIVRSSSYSGSNSNNFIFGIRNTTSTNYQVNYGYIKL
jgi:hypothetical protein